MKIYHEVKYIPIFIIYIQGINAITINPARPIPTTISKLWHCNYRMIFAKSGIVFFRWLFLVPTVFNPACKARELVFLQQYCQ